MNLLLPINYDPLGGAVSKSVGSALAMTVLDNVNLRAAVTVPAHGMLHIRMRCVTSGSTLVPDIFLGVFNGGSLLMRQAAAAHIDRGTAVSGARCVHTVEFVISGLTPGAINLDAAYGVETVAASGNIKYGGPDDATLDNAWGPFTFEVWDPRPLPTAAPGAANGVLIAGSNAAPSFAGINISGDIVMAGDIGIEGAVAVTADGNNSAVTLIGAGTGHGLLATGGASSGDGIHANSTGNGSGIGAVGDGTGHGIAATSGTGATGNGITATSAATNGRGIAATGNGTGDGVLATGGAGAGGDGIAAVAGGGVDIRGGVTGNITGNLSGSAGSVTGNVGGNVVGSVGSVVGAVGSVTGAVGSVTAAVTVGAIAANAITAAAIAADAGVELAAAVWAFAHEAGRSVKGVMVRLDAFISGKATGLRSGTARFYRADGTTVAIQASQNIGAGTRDAGTVAGD